MSRAMWAGNAFPSCLASARSYAHSSWSIQSPTQTLLSSPHGCYKALPGQKVTVSEDEQQAITRTPYPSIPGEEADAPSEWIRFRTKPQHPCLCWVTHCQFVPGRMCRWVVSEESTLPPSESRRRPDSKHPTA